MRFKENKFIKILIRNIKNYIDNTKCFHYTRLDISVKQIGLNRFNLPNYKIAAQQGSVVIVLLFIFLIFMIILINLYSISVNSLENANDEISQIKQSYQKEVDSIDLIYQSQEKNLINSID